jgi:DNA topoisomerase I
MESAMCSPRVRLRLKRLAPEKVRELMLQDTDPVVSARSAGLRYMSDDMPGIHRVRRGKGFSYHAADGTRIDDDVEIERIKALAIPPAWTDVWICPSPRGHIQASGRDDKGRKQYRYHDRWREVRDEAKFDRMIEFGQALPRIHARTDEDMRRHGLPREKVLAVIVRLLETTLIRVGNDEYARQNGSFGLTTLHNEHVDTSGSEISFQFRGKSGKDHQVSIRDRRLAATVRKLLDLPGQELFQYVDSEGELHTISSDDVNAYLRDIAGDEFTAKDFRTWAGTVLAARALSEFGTFDDEVEGRRNVVQAIESVARRLGNTPTICRKCYVHPTLIDAYLDDASAAVFRERAESELRGQFRDLSPEETAVLAFLQQQLAADANSRR